jgi:hypothetical protein
VAEGAAQWLVWIKFFHRVKALGSAGLRTESLTTF